jgi:hypothetical protein
VFWNLECLAGNSFQITFLLSSVLKPSHMIVDFSPALSVTSFHSSENISYRLASLHLTLVIWKNFATQIIAKVQHYAYYLRHALACFISLMYFKDTHVRCAAKPKVSPFLYLNQFSP